MLSECSQVRMLRRNLCTSESSSGVCPHLGKAMVDLLALPHTDMPVKSRYVTSHPLSPTVAWCSRAQPYLVLLILLKLVHCSKGGATSNYLCMTCMGPLIKEDWF